LKKNKIILGDSLKLGSSPAQKTSKGFKRRGKPLNGWSKEDKNIGKEFENWTYNWSSKAFPKLKDGSFAFVFSSRRYLHHVINAFEKSGFILKDIVIWKKKNAQYRAQAISKVLEKRGMIKEAEKWKSWRLGNLMPIQEPIAWFFKPYKIGTTITDNVLKNETGAFNGCLENKAPSNLLEYGLDKNRIHETQKPLELIKYLIQLTTITGQTILDPFSGSGTTAVACQELKRNFICFEKYCY